MLKWSANNVSAACPPPSGGPYYPLCKYPPVPLDLQCIIPPTGGSKHPGRVPGVAGPWWCPAGRSPSIPTPHAAMTLCSSVPSIHCSSVTLQYTTDNPRHSPFNGRSSAWLTILVTTPYTVSTLELPDRKWPSLKWPILLLENNVGRGGGGGQCYSFHLERIETRDITARPRLTEQLGTH